MISAKAAVKRRYCGARRKNGARCTRGGSGFYGLCRYHGGRNPRTHKRNTSGFRLAEPAKQWRQSLFKSWGMKWPGGPGPTIKEAITLMDEGEKAAEVALLQLPAVVDKPDEQKSAGELMTEGLHEGLIMGRDAVRYARKHLRQLEAAGIMVYGEDLKVLRWGTDTAGWLTRAGVKIAEGEMRMRRDDVLGKLLEQIAAGRSGKAIEPPK